MNFTAEQLAAIKDCSSTQEVIAVAAAEGLEISEEDAQELLDIVEFTEVDPADIDAAGGACKDDGLKPYQWRCPLCGQPEHREMTHHKYEVWDEDSQSYVYQSACVKCYWADKDKHMYRWNS